MVVVNDIYKLDPEDLERILVQYMDQKFENKKINKKETEEFAQYILNLFNYSPRVKAKDGKYYIYYSDDSNVHLEVDSSIFEDPKYFGKLLYSNSKDRSRLELHLGKECSTKHHPGGCIIDKKLGRIPRIYAISQEGYDSKIYRILDEVKKYGAKVIPGDDGLTYLIETQSELPKGLFEGVHVGWNYKPF